MLSPKPRLKKSRHLVVRRETADRLLEWAKRERVYGTADDLIRGLLDRVEPPAKRGR